MNYMVIRVIVDIKERTKKENNHSETQISLESEMSCFNQTV